MGFCQWPEIGSNVGKKWALGARFGENGSKPTCYPPWTHFGILTKSHVKLLGTSRGSERRLIRLTF